MSQEIKEDEWTKERDEKLKILQECQNSMGVNSCLKCDKTFDCNVRDEYIKAVYKSMNKDSGGGFEF